MPSSFQLPLLEYSEQPRTWPVEKPTSSASLGGGFYVCVSPSPPQSPVVLVPLVSPSRGSPKSDKRRSLAFYSLAALPGRHIANQSPCVLSWNGPQPLCTLAPASGTCRLAAAVSSASPTSSHGDALASLTRTFFLFIRFLITYYFGSSL